MIVMPDFFEHWKTKALIELTKRPESPLWVQRLWAHCQTRKAWEFRDLSDLALKSICGVPADITPEAWKSMLIQVGFVRVKGKTLIAHGWEEANSSLIVRWDGGRANKAKAAAENNTKQRGSRSQATGEQKPSSGGAEAKQRGSDGLEGLDREDRVEGEDKKESEDRAPRAQAGKPASLQEVEAYASEIGLSREEASKFFDHFEANGWRQGGRTAIKSWQAAARNWSRRAGEFGPGPGGRSGKIRVGGGGVAAAPFDPKTPHAHTGGLEVFNSEPAAGAAGGGA